MSNFEKESLKLLLELILRLFLSHLRNKAS